MKNVAILGATGVVGQEVLRVLEQRGFPAGDLYLYASKKSEGLTLSFRGEEVAVQSDHAAIVGRVDIVFSCLNETLARAIVPDFRSRSVVIDKSSAFRMDSDVPLIVPEVNPEKIREHSGIIANPNCSTIPLVVALNPLHRKARLRQIFVATYQSVSGAGRDGIAELQLEHEYLALGQPVPRFDEPVFPAQIGANVIPEIGNLNDQGYTTEELKTINETRKILGDESIRVSPTCVRVPVVIGHSEAVTASFAEPLSVAEAHAILKSAPGVELLEGDAFPTPLAAAGQDPVYVGRLRQDPAFENGIALWVVADNLRKGAALNAVQIAELLI